MRVFVVILMVIGSMMFSNCGQENAASNLEVGPEAQPVLPAAPRQPVLVELFTSEGCSSCPPADRELILLEKQQPVNNADAVTLEFHVDYWDGPSWKDAFSSAMFTRRQEEYTTAFSNGSNYTPQMIVDGRSEFVGSDLDKANRTIERSASEPMGRIDPKINGTSIKISISNLPAHDQATVFLATAEDGLVSDVTGGENAGEKLSHTSVVRDLRAVGVIEKGLDKVEADAEVPQQPEWKKENLRYVVFVQENSTRKVIAVNRVSK